MPSEVDVALSLLKIARNIPTLSQHGEAIGLLENGLKNNRIKINLVDANNLGRAGFYTRQGETQTTSVRFGNFEMPTDISINIPRGLFKNGEFDPAGIETLSHELTHAILKLDPKYQQTMGMIKKNPKLQLLVLAMHEYRNNKNINEAYKNAWNELENIKFSRKNIGEIIEERIASTSPLHMMWMMGYNPEEIISLAERRPQELKTPQLNELKLREFREKLPEMQKQFDEWTQVSAGSQFKDMLYKIVRRPEPIPTWASKPPEWVKSSAEMSGGIGLALAREAFKPAKTKLKI